MKAVGYVRVSTTEQADNGISLEAQRAKIKAYAGLKGFELLDIVEDRGVSAKNLRRPGIQRILELAKSKEIGAVVVYMLDRMFRNTVDALDTTRKFDKWGVSFHSIQETLDTKSAMGRFFFSILASVAELERGVIGERTRNALRHKRAMGCKTGGDVPFGHDLASGGILTPNTEEQKAISLIQRLKAKGRSLRVICMELERRGIKTKNGNASWHPHTVSRIFARA